MKYILMLFTLLVFVSCQDEQDEITAQEIIDKAIETSGGEKYERASVKFRFRSNIYKSVRNKGEFQLERQIMDSTGIYRDVVSNTGFQRFQSDSIVQLPDSLAVRYGSSVNSVHYFAHLPYGLNDKAVNKKLVGETIIKEQPYYLLQITFQQEGGGADHHDEFMYWIHKNKYTIDYLAYKFHVNEGGLRFRKAFNPRIIEGIRFVDYKNYTTEDFSLPMEKLDDLYEEGKLRLLSTIRTEDIEVELKQ